MLSPYFPKYMPGSSKLIPSLASKAQSPLPGLCDRFTADGLSMAFQQAHALAEALLKNDLARYQRAHRRIERLPRMMANLMLLMDRSHWLRARSLRALEASPNLFTRMLPVHTGELPLCHIGMEETLAFGWRLL